MSLMLMYSYVLVQIAFIFWLADTGYVGWWLQVAVSVVVSAQAMLIVVLGALSSRHWVSRIALSFAACTLVLSSLFLFGTRNDTLPEGGVLGGLGPDDGNSSTYLGLFATCAVMFACLSLARCRPLRWRIQFETVHFRNSENRPWAKSSLTSMLLSLTLIGATLALAHAVGSAANCFELDTNAFDAFASAAIIGIFLSPVFVGIIWSCLGRRRWPGWTLNALLVATMIVSPIWATGVKDKALVVVTFLPLFIVAISLQVMRFFGAMLQSHNQHSSRSPETRAEASGKANLTLWRRSLREPSILLLFTCVAYYGFVTSTGALGFHRLIWEDASRDRDICCSVSFRGAEPRFPLPPEAFFELTNESLESLPATCRFLGIDDENLAFLLRGACDDQTLDLLTSEFSSCVGQWGSLDLERMLISDKSMSFVARIHQLRSLNLASTSITDEGIAHLAELPNLYQLDLSETKIGDGVTTHLTGMTQLSVLSLSGTSLTDRGLSELDQLANLAVLSLGSTRITDDSLARIGTLPNLAHLDVSDTKITDAGMKYLRDLQLRVLYLDRTAVGDKGLSYVHGQPICAMTNLDTAITVVGLSKLLAAQPTNVTWDPWDLHRLYPPKPVAPELEAQLDVTAVFSGSQLAITGETNLPAATSLSLWLWVSQRSHGSYDLLMSNKSTAVNALSDDFLALAPPLKCKVDENGRFQFPSFEVKSEGTGNYRTNLLRIRIEMAPPSGQPVDVRAVIGDLGERLAGQHAFLQWTLSDQRSPLDLRISGAALTLFRTGSMDWPAPSSDSTPQRCEIHWDKYFSYVSIFQGARF